MKRPIILLALFFSLGALASPALAQVKKAERALKKENYEEALTHLEEALAKDPEDAKALELKGRAYEAMAFATEDPDQHYALLEEMMAAFSHAVMADPKRQEAIDNQLTLSFFKEFNLGADAFRLDTEESYADAALFFQGASLIRPDSTGPYINRGYALINGGKTPEAIEPFEMAIEKGESSEDVFVFLAELYQISSRFEDAVAVLESARTQHPESEDLQAQLLNAYIGANQVDRAVSVYKELVSQAPDNKLYHYNLGTLLLETEAYEEAIEHFNHAVELDEQYTNAQYNLGAAYLNQGVAVNDKMSTLDDELREKRDELSEDEVSTRMEEIDALIERKQELFSQAIPYLEKARMLTEAEGGDSATVCVALFQSYAQTGQTEKAESVQACAGL